MSQLTTAEAAKMMGIAEATLNEWRIRGQGPAYTKMGRLVRYPENEIERYIRERTIETSYRKRTAGEEREMGVSLQVERQPYSRVTDLEAAPENIVKAHAERT